MFRSHDVEVGEGTPLLRTENDINLNQIKSETLKEKIIAATAAIGCTNNDVLSKISLPLIDLQIPSLRILLPSTVVTSLLSIILEATSYPSVFVSGALGCILSPYAAIQQRKLTEVEALDQTNAALEVEIEQLSQENQTLKQNVQQLEQSVANLQAMEETLETLQSLQCNSIEQLETQLQESQEILQQQEHNVKSQVLQNLVSILLACDDDQDMLLSDMEIDEMIQQLETIQGVELKDNLLRETVVEHGRSVTAIMELVRNLLLAEDGDRAIFHYFENEQ